MSSTALHSAEPALLLGPGVRDVLAAVAGPCGAEVLSVNVCAAALAPDGGLRVQYRCRVRRRDGVDVDEVLVAATGHAVPAGATMVAGEVGDTPVRIGVWRWPQDPLLPGLPAASDPVRLAQILDAAGLSLHGTPHVAVLSYRPGQRAVLVASDGRRRWFVKVVTPDTVAGLVARHEMLGASLPVPPILHAGTDGLVVLPESPGTLMRRAPADALPDPASLHDLLDALPSGLLALPRRPGHLQRVRQSRQVLRMTLGPCPELDDFEALCPPPAREPVPVHGDFHDGQLLTDGGRIVGVIDVDTAGPGERADEWATLLGHLSVRALTRRNAADPAADPAADYAAAVFDHARRHIDAADLRARTAAVVLGLATGPFRGQRPDWAERTADRVELAARWLRSMRKDSSEAPAPLM